ncbi:hypothetical protein Taro_047032 [Colocasia esculenta]|uniref:WPP domain-associated protein n=1 Tax=Colocasia esculenta TaxID=4460 RepID=A0A843WRP1_COLES|nr:hypothetical protein [Colocasia esculenta]
MANLDILDTSTLVSDGCMPRSGSFKGNENVCFDSISDEDLLLKDLDSYWEDLNACLTVSRMVSDSIIRGMVNAVVQEAAENISSKEAEVARLNARLQLFGPDEFINCKSVVSPMQLRATSEVQSSCSGCSMGNTGHLGSVGIAALKHLQMLKNEIESLWSLSSSGMADWTHDNFCTVKQGNGLNPLSNVEKSIDALEVLLMTMCMHSGQADSSLTDTVYELRWRCNFEREVDTLIFQNFIGELQAEFEMKLHKECSLFDIQNKCQQKIVEELSNLRHELDSISRSILSLEPEHTSISGCHETFEELNHAKGGENFAYRGLEHNLVVDTSDMQESGFPSMANYRTTIPEVSDSSQILHMPKEDLVTYYKTEINNVKRHLESSLHEKTEELFRLKRECLKEKKGSLQCRREEDFVALKKKFLQIIAKLDKILSEAETCLVEVDHHKTCRYKPRIDSLFLEYEHLHDLLDDKTKKLKFISSRVSDAANQMPDYSSTEAHFLKKLKKLKWEIEDVKAEALFGKDREKCVLSELISQVKSQFVDFCMKNEMVEDLYSIMLRERTLDLENEKSEQVKQVSSLMILMDEKENALLLEVKKSEKLEQEIVSLLTLVEDKNKIASEVESRLEQQKKHFDKVFKEFNLLKDQACEHEKIISIDKEEIKLLKAKLGEASSQIHEYEAKVGDLTRKFVTVSNDLEEAGKQKTILLEIIQNKEHEASSATAKSEELMVQMASIFTFLQELSKSVAEFQSSILRNIQVENSRSQFHDCSSFSCDLFSCSYYEILSS